MAAQQLSNLDFANVAKIVNLPAPTASGDAANKGYVDSAIEGIDWKDDAVVRTTANVNLAAPGASLDGVAMSPDDRFVASGQSATEENGIYIWNGAATPATRSPDANTSVKLENAVIGIKSGTSAGVCYRQTSVGFVLDTDPVAFVVFTAGAPPASETTAGITEIATQSETDTGTDDARAITPNKLANWSNRKRKHAADIGDGSATQYDVTHNFGTRDVHVQVRRNSGNYDFISVETQALDVNTVRLIFASAPTTNLFRVIVLA